MRTSPLVAPASFVVSVAFAACSSSSSSSSPPATAADLDQALAASVKAYCGAVFDCCDARSKSALMQSYAGGNVDRGGCEGAVAASTELQAELQALKEALAGGHLTFHADVAAKCAKDDANRACPDFFKLGAQTAPHVACDAASQGNLRDGEACAADAVCTSGFCVQSKCAKRPSAGDPCEASQDCGTRFGLYCERNTPSCTRNPSGTCTTRGSKKDGAACCIAEQCASGGCSGGTCTAMFALRCGGG